MSGVIKEAVDDTIEIINRIDKKIDLVNSPDHYNQGDIECIDAIQAVLGEDFEHYLHGNALKYLWRFKYKGGLQDLEKCQWYLKKLMNETYNA